MNMGQMLEFRLVVPHLIQLAECDGIGLGRGVYAPDADDWRAVRALLEQTDRVIADKTAYVKKEQILDEEG